MLKYRVISKYNIKFSDKIIIGSVLSINPPAFLGWIEKLTIPYMARLYQRPMTKYPWELK